jgi:hypothetical protein
MRTEDEVLDKFREVFARTLRDRTDAYLERTSINCMFNLRHRLKKYGLVGFCNNPIMTEKARNGVVICNDNETACACQCYECKHTEETVKADLNDIMRSPSKCGHEYPKLAVLLWFLQRDGQEKTRGGLGEWIRGVFNGVGK